MPGDRHGEQISVGFRKRHFNVTNKVIKLIIHEEISGQERQSFCFCSHGKDHECPIPGGFDVLVCPR